MCPVYWLLLLCLEAPLLRPLFLYPASASQLCVGGCSFVREAVGILSSPVIISEEMHIMVVWQQHSEVTQSQICTGAQLGTRALSPLALHVAIPWGWMEEESCGEGPL